MLGDTRAGRRQIEQETPSMRAALESVAPMVERYERYELAAAPTFLRLITSAGFITTRAALESYERAKIMAALDFQLDASLMAPLVDHYCEALEDVPRLADLAAIVEDVDPRLVVGIFAALLGSGDPGGGFTNGIGLRRQDLEAFRSKEFAQLAECDPVGATALVLATATAALMEHSLRALGPHLVERIRAWAPERWPDEMHGAADPSSPEKTRRRMLEALLWFTVGLRREERASQLWQQFLEALSPIVAAGDAPEEVELPRSWDRFDHDVGPPVGPVLSPICRNAPPTPLSGARIGSCAYGGRPMAAA